MERLNLQLENHQVNVQPSSQCDSSRISAIAAMLQQSRALSGWNLLSETEMPIQLLTWKDALCSLPDAALKASFDKATQQHDWAKPFSPMEILTAYKALIIEDRERIDAEQKRSRWNNSDTYGCWKCEDSGYTPLMVYCPATKRSRRVVRACDCDFTPISQRMPAVVNKYDWTKNSNGVFEPKNEASGLPCGCLFCGRKPNEYSSNKADNRSNVAREADDDFTHGIPDHYESNYDFGGNSHDRW